MLGVAALAVSFFAVALSAGFAARQILLMRNANYVPVLVDLLGQFRSMEFNDNYLYVCTRLQHEQDPAKGISGLPADVRAKIYDVAYFYQLFAALVALKVVKEQDIVAVLRDRIVHVWQAVEPFVHTERSSTVPTGPFLMRNLEEFAKRAQTMPATTIEQFMRGNLPASGGLHFSLTTKKRT
ncbi:hypothetical protein GCM10023170_088450 [Phytohabitans houttuyneae]|uniref:Uncharacterized protein n=2 Tax=Phytohabitans houttuyneae TaxID=1076126 RepID=A0A6V8K9Q7_9ACTN|nr:hypothetical protein Phou_016550 [Phytohabitans houttuyneae]